MSLFIFPRWCALGAAAFASAVPLSAQPAPVPIVAPEEIVIVGHYGRLPDNVESLSMAVGYADLDLSNPAGREILRHRISLTARFLCDRLGESDTATFGPSCRDAATEDAMRRIGTIWAHFAPRGTTWVRPPAWVPPYPVVWVQQYP